MKRRSVSQRTYHSESCGISINQKILPRLISRRRIFALTRNTTRNTLLLVGLPAETTPPLRGAIEGNACTLKFFIPKNSSIL
jgi:hypothetical protein